MPDPGRRQRLRRVAPRALGAVAGQVTQAGASVVLQVLAARLLGVDGLGLFAILYGAIVLGTAVATGMVGDSLTVLERGRADIRVALVRWCLVVAAAAGVLAALVAGVSGAVAPGDAALFGGAACVFIVEDALRRLLMAVGRFWSLVVVDLSSLVTSVAVLVALRLSTGDLGIGSFMAALMVGQLVALGVAARCLPAGERSFPVRGSGAMRAVLAFGSWRSLQLSVRPATLMVFRFVVTIAAGLAAYGAVEAARIYVSPALIAIGGIGSFLMPMYARRTDVTTSRLVRRADAAALALLVVVLLVGAAAVLLLPWVGPLLTGGDFEIATGAVLAWTGFAAATAALTPYTTLGAVRGRQSVVTAVRLLDPTVSVLLLVPALALDVELAPLALAGGTVVAGLVVRHLLRRGHGPDEVLSPSAPASSAPRAPSTP